MILREIAAPYLFVAAPELPEYAQCIDSGQSHDQQETTKSDQQRQTGIREHAVPAKLT